MSDTNISKDVLNVLDGILLNANLNDVNADDTGFGDLPDGYYLCEVEKSTLTTSKSSGQPMAAFTFKIVEDGIDVVADESGNYDFKKLKSTKNRKIFKNYVLKDDTSIRRFASDMLKFEGDVEGEPLLPKEAFTTSETLIDALDILVGMRLYLNVNTTVNTDGSKNTWNSPISWKRARKLELPM